MITGELAACVSAMERYFEAFEAGTLEAQLCNEKVRALRTRLDALELEKQALETRREKLEIPAIDRDMLASLVDRFEQVMTEGPKSAKETPSPPTGEEGARSSSSNH